MEPEDPRTAVCCQLVRDVVCDAGEVRLRLTGTSMLPAMRPGDVVTVRRCNIAELQPGQIVLFHRDSRVVAHRVLRKLQDGLIVRGDSVPFRDAPLKAFEVVGHVAGIVRNGCSIPLERSLLQRAGAAVLRHSDFCTRVFLFFGESARTTSSHGLA